MSQNTPEGKVKKALDSEIKRLQREYPGKIWYCAPQAGAFGRAGIPDRIGCVAGRMFAVECKADATKQLTLIQVRESISIIYSGGAYFLVNSLFSHEPLINWITSQLAKELLTNDQSQT